MAVEDFFEVDGQGGVGINGFGEVDGEGKGGFESRCESVRNQETKSDQTFPRGPVRFPIPHTERDHQDRIGGPTKSS